MNSRVRFIIFFTCCLLLVSFASVTSLSVADDHKGGKNHFEKHDAKRGFGGFKAHGHDKGNEATGQVAAWSLVVANLTVVMSLFIGGIKQYAPLSQETRSALSKFNSLQKKYLMRFHYVLNPLILAIAILHYALSRCRATALPEWGLLAMGVIVVLGITLKFKLCPKALLRNVYSIHTKPWMVMLFVSLLLIGHLSMD